MHSITEASDLVSEVEVGPATPELNIDNEVKSVSKIAEPSSSNELLEGIETDVWEPFKRPTTSIKKKKKKGKKKASGAKRSIQAVS